MATFDKRKALAQMTKVAETPVDLELKAGEMVVLISTIQLACRHPSFVGESRRVAERVARNWQDIVADPGSDMWLALEAGWDPGQDTYSASVARTADKGTGRPLQGQAGDKETGQTIEVGRGNKDVVRGLTKALVATLQRWIGDHGPVDFIDVFMAAHNYHCHVIFDLEKQTGDSDGTLRKMGLDTFRARLGRENYDSAGAGVTGDDHG